MLHAVAQGEKAAVPVLGHPGERAVGQVFGHDDHVASSRRKIGHSFGHFGAEIIVVVSPVCGVALRIEVVICAREIGLVRAGYDNEPAVAGENIGQIKEKHQVIVVYFAVLDKTAAPARLAFLQGYFVARMQGVKGFAVDVDHHVAAA